MNAEEVWQAKLRQLRADMWVNDGRLVGYKDLAFTSQQAGDIQILDSSEDK